MGEVSNRRRITKSILIALAATAILFAIFIAAPLPFTPDRGDVAKIELWASHNTCVDNLAKWSRTYTLPGGQGLLPDFNQVLFSFEDPDVPNPDGSKRSVGLHIPWRQSMLFGTGWADDRQQRFAYGVFDRKRQVVTEWTCGCSIAGTQMHLFPKCDG